MMSYSFKTDQFTRHEWTDYCNCFAQNNHFQSWDWGTHLSPRSLVRDVSRCGLFLGSTPVCLAQMRLKRLPFLNGGVMDLKNGPLWRIEDHPESLQSLEVFLHELRNYYCHKQNLEIRIFPEHSYPYDITDAAWDVFRKSGFVWYTGTETYNTTFFIDVTADIETIRENLHSSWRRKLKKAENANLTIESGSTLEHFDRFHRLYSEMLKVKRFPTGVKLSGIREMYRSTHVNRQFIISIVKENAEDVGGALNALNGTRMLYFLGATSPGKRGNSPGYLLHWSNILLAKELGLKSYDVGGIGSGGVASFKSGMGGVPRSIPYEFRLSPPRGHSLVFRLAEFSYQRIRTLRVKSSPL